MVRKIVRWIIVILIIAAAVFAVRHYTKPNPLQVVVKPVERGLVEQTVVNTRAGTVKACRRAKLSPSLGGQISKLPVREGDEVKEGQLLLEIWNKDLVAEMTLAEREVDSAKARATSACLNAEVTRREADRISKLQKFEAVSEEETDKAETQAKALFAECEAAKVLVLTNKASLDVIKERLSKTRLLAPFDGVVAEISGELNEYVTPSPPGIPTPPVVDLIDNTCFYVTAPIDEVDAAAISKGMPARVVLDAFGDRHFEGRVRRIAPYVLDREKQARTVDVEVELTHPEEIVPLLAGYSADAEIILETRQDVLRIPTETVLDEERVFVYLPMKGIIEERIVKIGLSNWEYTEVLSGLDLGELVVTNVDQAGVADGAQAMRIEQEP
jgi:HlyD family secretion protein